MQLPPVSSMTTLIWFVAAISLHSHENPGGQLGPLPGQRSSASHTFAAGRQMVPEDLKVSAGQSLLLPLQVSALSQLPAAGRHGVPAVSNLQLAVQQSPDTSRPGSQSSP